MNKILIFIKLKRIKKVKILIKYTEIVINLLDVFQ
jgi:hypothetical protein